MSSLLQSKPFRQHLQESSRLIRLAVRLAWRSSPRLALGILLLLVVQALLSPLQLVLSRAVIDRAALDLGVLATAAGLVAQWPLAVWIILAAAGVAVGQLIQPFASTFQSMAGDRLTGYVTEQLIRTANRWHGIARFEDPALADDLERARGPAANSGMSIMVDGTELVVALFTAAGLAVVLLALHPVVPVLLVVATLPLMAREWEYQYHTTRTIYEQTPETRRLMYASDMLLRPEPAKDVRLYALGPFFRTQYDTIFAGVAATINRLRRQLMTAVVLTNVLAAAAVGSVYVYIVWLVATGQRTPGDLALYGGAATMLQQRLTAVGYNLGYLPLLLNYLPSLFRVLEAPPDLPVPASPRSVPPSIRAGITFEQVAFTYPGQSGAGAARCLAAPRAARVGGTGGPQRRR